MSDTDASAGVHRISVGQTTCAIVSDGTFAYHDPAAILFATAPRDSRDRVLRASGLDPDQWHEYVSPYPSLVVDTGQHRVLVDTGAGGFAPTNGKLVTNLRSAGIEPGTIDTVVLTHGHADHIGGNVDADGRLVFPNARHVMWRDEWRFWTREPDLSPLPVSEQIKELLVAWARRNLPPIERQLDLIDQESEIVPGVRAVAAPGHTPGHTALLVESGGERLFWSVDTVLHPVHVAHPEWCAAVDLLPDQVVASRRRLLGWAADEELLVHAYHFPWPGLGHVVRQAEGWRWEPAG